jgi:hypothetical protein
MFRSERTANARKGDVHATTRGFDSGGKCKGGIPSSCAPDSLTFRAGSAQDATGSRSDYFLDFNFELIDALSGIALRIFGRSFKPCFIDLGQDTVRSRHPTVTKYFPFVLAVDRFRLHYKRRQKLLCSFLQSSGREILKLRNCVCQFFLRTHANILISRAPTEPRPRDGKRGICSFFRNQQTADSSQANAYSEQQFRIG